jgi:malto-oligosyltrehalose trehalohydrolase
MKRRYDMPFGAACLDDGSVRFRLWAPAARQVDLSIVGSRNPIQIPLEARSEGWFELITEGAQAGSQYRFRIDGEQEVPDPASRFQPHDVHGPSEVIDPNAFDWKDHAWQGRPWEEAVIYELHVGAFTPSGTFGTVRDRLAYLAELGVTAVELMPVADFPGQRNWGYDGVYPFAPDSTYGRPEDLKNLVQSAHELGLMVLLDVVYNHFGPEGNYLASYAPQFFTSRHCTPWGDGINFDGARRKPVRDFFVHNALYWLTEYYFDGLRLDAVHAISDDSTPDILTELANEVRNFVEPGRYVHLILENDRNQAQYLRRTAKCQPKSYNAQWNDDIHHALHVLITNERDGYYVDYSSHPLHKLGRCLVEGFSYQGEPSAYRNGQPRGESTWGVPLSGFVSFLQNHDQIGNRPFGDRIITIADCRAVRAAAAILLLAPSPPLIFMGEEFGAKTPFLFFCDFERALASAVTTGRRNEFSHFAGFRDPVERERIPDPCARSTFEASRLIWDEANKPHHQDWLGLYRRLLKVRSQYIVPRLKTGCKIYGHYEVQGDRALTVHWKFSDETRLVLMANLGGEPIAGVTPPISQVIFSCGEIINTGEHRTLSPWSVLWLSES